MAANIFTEILIFSKQLSAWQNEAIRRLFKNGFLTPLDKDEIYNFAQQEYGILRASYVLDELMLKESDLPQPPAPGGKVILRGLKEVIGVNALKENQHLKIGDQLTIIYGDNGSGKSGYARIMKKAFRARAVDPILPNVYKKTDKNPAKATFEIAEDGKIKDEKWEDGKESSPCFGRFAVFDGNCARVYVNNTNQLSFLPYGFDIIHNLSAVTIDTKLRFADLSAKLSPNPNALKFLVDSSKVGKTIESINFLTKVETIKQLAAWDSSCSDLLASQETALAKLKGNSPKALRDAATEKLKHIRFIKNFTQTTSDAVSDAKIATIKDRLVEFKNMQEAVSASAKAAFGELNLPGIGGDIWRELLLAAIKFSTQEAFPGQPFPPEGADRSCVLCLQPLGNDASHRLKMFWDFVRDDVSSKRDIAKTNLEKLTAELAKLPRKIPKEIEVLEGAIRVGGSSIYDQITLFSESLTARIRAIEQAIVTGNWTAIPEVSDIAFKSCVTEETKLEGELASIADDQSLKSKIESTENEVRELTARKRLNENLDLVLGHLKALLLAEQAKQAEKRITTTGISNKASELQTKFVTDAFKKRIQEELAPLNLVRVKAGVDKKTEKGKVFHWLTVDGGSNVTPEQVFSEGERTALSLACFLAELKASDDNCGIIFDDPVTSLDHQVREKIVERLVREAKFRQVIIFTHDLIFYRELLGSAARLEIQAHSQHVLAMGSSTGLLSDHAPLALMKVGARVSKLDSLLKTAKEAEEKGDSVAYHQIFVEFYGLLRSTWERSVEELLFSQVVQRMEKEVKTMRLTDVSVDNESVRAVFDGMTRTSAMIEAHDHAVAVGTGLVGYEELKSDLTKFKEFEKMQNEKIKKARKDNEHLKKPIV